MSKYHKGDKFIVEIKEVINSDNGTLYRSDFKTLTFDDNGLDKLKKCEQPTISEDTLEMERMKALNEGRNEVWELAKKIAVEPEIGGYDGMQLHDIFGFSDMDGVFTSYSPQEALAKLEAYEKEQNEIKVGDVVESTTTGKEFLIITEENDDSDYEFGVIDLEGMIIDRICNDTRYFKKTGKHIDIQSLLEQIKE